MKKINKFIAATLLMITVSGSKVFAVDNRFDNEVKDYTICSQQIYEGNINGGNGYYQYDELKSYFKRNGNGTIFSISLNNKNMNMEMYGDKGIFVYGEPTDISNNEFQQITNGYFTLNGISGEYKYLGCDYNGIPVQNPYFSNNLDNYIIIDKPWTVKAVYSKYNMINAQKEYDNNFLNMAVSPEFNYDIKQSFGFLTANINGKKIALNDFMDKNKFIEDVVVSNRTGINSDQIISVYVIDLSKLNPEVKEIVFHQSPPSFWQSK